jgi:hypothetical protein
LKRLEKFNCVCLSKQQEVIVFVQSLFQKSYIVGGGGASLLSQKLRRWRPEHQEFEASCSKVIETLS